LLQGEDDVLSQRILLAEDDEGLRLLYREELQAEGYDVVTACNGKEAIHELEQGPFDLVILDIVMPEMDGIEALGRIIGKHRKIPVILHTSHADYRRDFMSWAADAYLMKSSDLTELKQKVKELLERDTS